MKDILIWILYHEKDVAKNIWFIETFIKKCNTYNVDMKLITVEQYLSEKLSGTPDAVIARMINPAVSKMLEDEGIRVYNNFKVSYICNNKAECIRYADSLGVRHIPTIAISLNEYGRYVYELIYNNSNKNNNNDNRDDDIDLFTYKLNDVCPYNDMPEKYVIKSVSGHGGREVMLLSDYFDKYNCSFEDFKPAPVLQERTAADYYADKYVVQPLIECDGRDLRVYIVGGRIIGAVLRTAHDGFKSNFSLGGSVELYTLNDAQKSIVKKITDSLAIDYGGLDFLVCGKNDELVFNEIEDVVGARMLSECSDIDYIGCYVKHIIGSLSV